VKPGRVEVAYATFTDAATGLGGWVHRERVAPKDGSAVHTHGWVAVFPPPGAGPPRVERFAGDGPTLERGEAGALRWSLTYADGGPPLHTFGRRVWERDLLPGAQMVPSPRATVHGSIEIDGSSIAVDGHGAVAAIQGHGSAHRWGWLHADLGDGAVLEVVTASANRPGLRRLPPLALVQLRLPGVDDWPPRPLLAAPRFRTRLRPDGFAVRGRGLAVDVTLPADGCVELTYTDPDGSTATCRNSERASATVAVAAGSRSGRWVLDGTAHAEVGRRP
jgi:hypothetical protein